jgi:hypothetical protein
VLRPGRLQLVESEQEAETERESEQERECELELASSQLPVPRSESNWSHWKSVLAADSVQVSPLRQVRPRFSQAISTLDYMKM